jgi:hypothetical protein
MRLAPASELNRGCSASITSSQIGFVAHRKFFVGATAFHTISSGSGLARFPSSCLICAALVHISWLQTKARGLKSSDVNRQVFTGECLFGWMSIEVITIGSEDRSSDLAPD